MVHTLSSPPVDLESEQSIVIDDLGIVRALKRRWLWTLGTTFVVGGLATIYTLVQTPMYESRFRLILGSSSFPSLNIPGLGGTTNSTLITRDQATNIAVLQSLPILSQGVERLNERGIFEPIEISDVRDNLTIQPVSGSDIITVNFKDPIPERAALFLNELEKIYLQFSLDQRTIQARNSLDLIQNQLPLMEAKLAESSQQLEDFRRQYGFPDPDSYAAALTSSRTAFERNLRDTDIQITQLQQQQQSIANQLQLSGGDPVEPISGTILSQNPEYLRLVGQLEQTEAQIALERLRFQENSPPIQRLIATREQLLLLIEQQIISSVGSANPLAVREVPVTVPLLTDSIVSASPLSDPIRQEELGATTQQEPDDTDAPRRATALQQSLTTELLSTQVNIAVQESRRLALESAVQSTLESFDQLPPLQRRYAELLRQVNLDTTAITTFRQRQQDLLIAQAQEVPPWQVVETATVPTAPVSPNVTRNIVFGYFAGALLGAILAVGIENLDPRIKTVQEAKSATKLVPLAMIPRLPGSSRREAKQQKLSKFGPIVEAFRSLAFSIIYNGKSLRTLLFTSSLPAEGKSTSSYYLALALAEFGQRVLLVDADMRRPTQHQILGIPNALGLSTVLSGQKPWQDLIYRHPEQSQLDVLVAGPHPLNPVLLLGSVAMQKCLQEWQKTYDIIIVDTPPLVGIADAQVVAKHVDATVLVVGLGVSDFNALGRTVELLRRDALSLLGILINYVPKNENGYNYYSDYSNPQESSAVALNGSRPHALNGHKHH